jgi:hypothetical protein
MYRHLQEKGVDILRVRENNFSVGVYCNDPDGNGIEVYYEEPGAIGGPRKDSMPGSWRGSPYRRPTGSRGKLPWSFSAG